ncbi:MAG: 2-oxo acid dehydrogenase subunit E2 [Haloquadratum sp.]
MAERTFELPDLGEGIAEGELVSWLVTAGETVEQDQTIAEVETDKALVEVPSPYDGTVTRLHHDEGETVPVGSTIATFEVEGDRAGDEASSADASATADGTDAEPGATAAGDGTVATTEDESSVPEGRVFAAPSVRTLARRLGIDLEVVEGSGPGGRITEADVRAHAGEAPTTETGEAPTAETGDGATVEGERGGATGGETAERADRDRTLAMPATRRLAEELGVDIDAVPATEERDGEPFVTPEDVRQFAAHAVETAEAAASGDTTAEAAASGETTAGAPTADAAGEAAGESSELSGERVPYRGIRRTIGEQMARSKYTAPHVAHHDEFDASQLVEVREELAAVAKQEGVKLTYLPFVVKAITTALQEFPYFNASLDEEAEEIVLYDEYNVGIAVATDAGLMVPVVDDADRKGLKQLAEEIRDLAERARNREIAPEEMQGGTFTITNVGVIGGEFSAPIINYPEAAIFAMGSIEKRPWVVDDDVVARETMRFSMSVDHRLVDGADVANFANRVKELLADPSRLLLE